MKQPSVTGAGVQVCTEAVANPMEAVELCGEGDAGMELEGWAGASEIKEENVSP